MSDTLNVDPEAYITIREKDLRDAWLRLDAVGDPRTAHTLWQHLLGVTLTGVRSSEATIGDCSCVDAKGSNPHCRVHHPFHSSEVDAWTTGNDNGANAAFLTPRSSEVDGHLTWVEVAADRAIVDLRRDGAHTSANDLRAAVDALRVALTGDTGPKVRYSCPDEPPTPETRHLYCAGCLSYFDGLAAPVTPDHPEPRVWAGRVLPDDPNEAYRAIAHDPFGVAQPTGPDDLAGLRALSDAATPGEWKHWTEAAEDGYFIDQSFGPKDGAVGGTYNRTERGNDNARFICSLVNWFRGLTGDRTIDSDDLADRAEAGFDLSTWTPRSRPMTTEPTPDLRSVSADSPDPLRPVEADHECEWFYLPDGTGECIDCGKTAPRSQTDDDADI